MVEGDNVFKEAISYLKKLDPLPPLQWDENLAMSAMEHVSDIGPKGLLLYQSSDGMEPEERIGKFGNYIESLGENIDFGPNDALGVIISLTLDDGEESRPHRDNLFKSEYHKVGIACGPHKTEFQMCVMDFAYDFLPLGDKGDKVLNVGKGEMLNNSNYGNNGYGGNNNAVGNNVNQSPLVKLSLENDEFKNALRQYSGSGDGKGAFGSDVDVLTRETKNLMKKMKVVEKKVEIITTVTYTYNDGTTKEMTQTEKHSFKF